MLDPISDMLTRIRNAQAVGHGTVSVSASRIKLAIARILESEGFVSKVSEDIKSTFPSIEIELLYEEVLGGRKVGAIRSLRRISTEGQRLYVRKDGIKKVKNGYGIAIISTSRGVMTGYEAYKNGLGGEYICEVS